MSLKGNIARRRVCYHESGHAVLGVLFWQKMEFARINDFSSDAPLLGFVRFLERCELLRNSRGNEAAILIEMAGTVAQFSYLENRTGEDLTELIFEEWHGGGGGESESDYDRICAALDAEFSAVGLDVSERLRYYYELYFLELCREVLRKPPVKTALISVAEHLFQSGELSGAKIYDLCYAVDGFESVAEKLRGFYFDSWD